MLSGELKAKYCFDETITIAQKNQYKSYERAFLVEQVSFKACV